MLHVTVHQTGVTCNKSRFRSRRRSQLAANVANCVRPWSATMLVNRVCVETAVEHPHGFCGGFGVSRDAVGEEHLGQLLFGFHQPPSCPRESMASCAAPRTLNT